MLNWHEKIALVQEKSWNIYLCIYKCSMCNRSKLPCIPHHGANFVQWISFTLKIHFQLVINILWTWEWDYERYWRYTNLFLIQSLINENYSTGSVDMKWYSALQRGCSIFTNRLPVPSYTVTSKPAISY